MEISTEIKKKFCFVYSNLKASIGFSLAAFLAGIIPKISPIEIEESTAINTDLTEMTA